MLRRILIYFSIAFTFFLLSINSYGQVSTSIKDSNKKSKQLQSYQKQATIIDNVAQSPFATVTSPIPPNTETRISDTNNKYYDKSSSEWWLVYFTAALVAVVGLQFIWMIRQERWMRRNVELIRQNMISSQRAFVFFKEFDCIEVTSAPGLVNNWRITAVLKNSGETQTKYLLNNINWKECPPAGLPEDFDFPDRSYVKPAYAFIGPKATIHSPPVDIPITILEKVSLGQVRLFIWGWVDYNDTFDETPRHRTEFCFEIAYDNGLIGFIGCGKHNSADDECYRKPSPYTPPT